VHSEVIAADPHHNVAAGHHEAVDLFHPWQAAMLYPDQGLVRPDDPRPRPAPTHHSALKVRPRLIGFGQVSSTAINR
jgi:hypothetical protein